jgi:hydroxypyruvate isomerase
MPLKQSFCYGCFLNDGTTLDELFAEAATIGFTAMELWFRDEQFGEMMAAAKRQGLSVASMCGHDSLEDGLNNSNNHDRIEFELRESIDVAVEHGISGLICFSGNRLPDQSDEEGLEICAKGLKRVAPYAEERGINLNVELLNSRVDHSGYLCDRTAWGVALCERVASPRVKLLYDIYHMQIMEGDVIRTIRDNIAWIGHFHTAGNPGRHEMDDSQELNYTGICRAIRGTGYDLYIGHELIPEGDKIAALKQAFESCNKTGDESV